MYTSEVRPVRLDRPDTKAASDQSAPFKNELIRCGPPPRESPGTGTRSVVNQPFNFEGPVCPMEARVLRVLHRTRRRGPTNRPAELKFKKNALCAATAFFLPHHCFLLDAEEMPFDQPLGSETCPAPYRVHPKKKPLCCNWQRFAMTGDWYNIDPFPQSTGLKPRHPTSLPVAAEGSSLRVDFQQFAFTICRQVAKGWIPGKSF